MIEILMFKILMIAGGAIIGASAGLVIGKLVCWMIDKIKERIRK